jgi:hypothetical protein
MSTADPNRAPQPEVHEKPVAPGPDNVGPLDPRAERLAAAIVSLQQSGRRGANWFYWVAGLSVLNSLLIHLGANIYFVVGLGLSLVADGIASHLAGRHPEQAVVLRGAAIAFTLIVSGAVVLLGWLANRRYLSVFALGMVLYLLDGLIFLLDLDFLSIAFHAYALYCMWTGLLAYRKVNQIERDLRRTRPTGDLSEGHGD